MKKADEEKVESEDDDQEVRARVRDGSVSWRGSPDFSRLKTGGWKAAIFIQVLIGGDAFSSKYGISCNLVPYLITTLRMTNIDEASVVVNNFLGLIYLLAIVWGFLADTLLGRYKTTLICSFFTATGLVVLTLSATLKELNPGNCLDPSNCKSATNKQLNWFYTGLYMTAIASAGIWPCTMSLGREQYEDGHPTEHKQGKEFFKYLFVNLNVNALVAVSVGFYIQTRFGYKWGWGSIAVIWVLCSLAFLCGTPYYRYRKPEGSVLTSIFQVIVVAAKNVGKPLPPPEDLYELDDRAYKFEKKSRLGKERVNPKRIRLARTDRLRFLEKSAIRKSGQASEAIRSPWKVCTVTQVEEVKSLMQILPIWFCSILVYTVCSVFSTLTVATALTMDRRIGKIVIPAGSTIGFLIIGVLIFSLVFDFVIIPLAKKITKQPDGLSDLQQMGIAHLTTLASLVAAVLVEGKRVRTIEAYFQPSDYAAIEAGVKPIPMSVFWLFPQYALMGVVDYLIGVAQLNFFHVETPESMRSVGISLFLITVAFGYFTATALVKEVNVRTYKQSTGGGWLSGLQVFQGGIQKLYFFFTIIIGLNVGIYLLSSYWYQHKVVQEEEAREGTRQDKYMKDPQKDNSFAEVDSNHRNRASSFVERPPQAT